MLHQIFPLFFLLVINRFTIIRAVLTKTVNVDPLDAFAKLNFTKKPLNFYIIANGKHATVERRTLGGVEAAADDVPVDYRIAQPPFAIKRRGSVVLLHNATGDSLSWHRGRPSLLQMIAASGHTTIAVEVPSTATASDIHKRLRQIVADAERLANITFVTADVRSADAVDALLSAEPLTVAPKVDGLIFINHKEARKQKKHPTPTVIIELDNGKTTMFVDDGPMTMMKRLRLTDAVVVGSAAEEQKHRERLMQIFVNFLEFIHPR